MVARCVWKRQSKMFCSFEIIQKSRIRMGKKCGHFRYYINGFRYPAMAYSISHNIVMVGTRNDATTDETIDGGCTVTPFWAFKEHTNGTFNVIHIAYVHRTHTNTQYVYTKRMTWKKKHRNKASVQLKKANRSAIRDINFPFLCLSVFLVSLHFFLVRFTFYVWRKNKKSVGRRKEQEKHVA